MRIQLTSLLLLLLAFACSTEQAQFDEDAPVVDVRQPKSGQQFHGDVLMPVEVVLTENLGLHTYFIWLVETESGAPHLVDKAHLHARSHTVDTSYATSELPAGNYELVVTATDHDQNTTEVRVPLAIE